jgi:hypothetical protein
MKLVSALLVLGVLACWGCGGQTVLTTSEPVKLEYSSLGGTTFPYKWAYSVTMNVEGSTDTWVSDITYVARVDTIDPEGSIIRRLTFDAFSITRYSGAAPAPDPDAVGYKGEYLWLKMGPAGQVTDWKGLDKIKSYTSEGKNLTDVLIEEIAILYQPLPKDPVTVGSTWQSSLEMPVMTRGGEFKQTIKVNYEVTGFGMRAGRACAKVRLTTVARTEGSGMRGVDRQFWVESSGGGKGELWFDYGKGLPVEFNLRTTLDQVMRYERAGKEDVTTETSTVDSEVKIKLAQ